MKSFIQSRILRVIFLLLVALMCIAAISLIFTAPRSDRNWLPEYEKVATATIADDTVTLRNVRDWTFSEEGPVTKDWITASVDANAISRVWFILEPFPEKKYLSHTMLSFEFEDGTILSFSVEARKEVGETYSAFSGLTKGYELIYVWGTERDSIGLVLAYLNRSLHLYPLVISKKQAASLFLAIVEETNELSAEPRFYNSLTANCTNTLARIVNELSPDTLPRDISWYITGNADYYLMRQGFINLIGSSEEGTREHYNLTRYKNDVIRVAGSSPKIFSHAIREFMSP